MSRTLIYGFGDRSATIYTNLIYVATYTGLEPVTSCVTGMRSALLNYETKYLRRVTPLTVSYTG